MKKKQTEIRVYPPHLVTPRRLFLGTKLLFFFLFFTSLNLSANVWGQQIERFVVKDATLEECLEKIEQLTGNGFFYNKSEMKNSEKITLNLRDVELKRVLAEVVKGTGFEFDLVDDIIVVKKSERQPAAPQVSNIRIQGVVKDKSGAPLPGVTVSIKENPGQGTATNFDGAYVLLVPRTEPMTLVFSFVGMKTQEIRYAGQTELHVTLEDNATELSSVVVQAGIIQRDKVSFTGSVKTVTKEELKSIGNMNVIQTLRSLDPSFVIAENNLRGSDPNTLGNISIRGGSTINVTSTFDDMSVNPNQPLFILDGFPTTLQVINDMDINRIESITILKDAGSTAIYGSQGGNGVIVVETVKPKPGEVIVNYNGDFQLSVADLSVYDLMNASEKLEYEARAGRFGDLSKTYDNRTGIADYYSRLEKVAAGINTYWLKVPIRTGLSQNHSLQISGGESGFLYQVGAQYRNVQGVMKGSSRETFGGNVRLQYRQERFNIMNDLSVLVTNGYDGAWTTGNSFRDFAQANPYYRMKNDDGSSPEFLDSYKDAVYTERDRNAPNPYWNAKLGSKAESKTFSLTNNTRFEWFILPNLRWTSDLQLWANHGTSISFLDPSHTSYSGQDYTLQGRYTRDDSKPWKYSANTNLAYSLSFRETHNLAFFGRAAIESEQTSAYGTSVSGFPKGVPANPKYAYGYEKESRPAYTESIRKMASFMFAFNYNYLYRYLLDFSWENDGSTAFGQNQKFHSFWSVGAGWNVDREAFAENWEWMQALKFRGSYGKNGNQNADNLSTNVYSYYSGSNVFGSAAYLSGVANPNLKWQVVEKANVGMDLTLLQNRLNVTLDVYQTNTDPLVIDITQKPSSGVTSYPINLGYLDTKGLEFSFNYQIIRDVERDMLLSVRVNGHTYRSKYDGFANALNSLNEEYKKEEDVDPSLNVNSLVQFRDGASPDDLWAVRSLGIDPGTGREVFLDRFNTPTLEYNADDRVAIASRTPDLEGIFGFTFRYKTLTANFNFRYSFGGYEFNSALFNKVENITSTGVLYNQDRRALHDRWQNPGDVAQFKSITINTTTPMSSRFIQRNDFLSGESARISWDFTRSKWIKTVGLENLTLIASYSDLFYLSTMKRERGIDYPFARSVSFGLSAQF